MAAHLYWRINVTANNGDPTYLAINEVEMRATIGGADQCNGGVATASSEYSAAYSAAKAFDNVAGATNCWYTPQGTITGWLRYQFVSPVEVLQYTVQAETAAYAPRTWTLEYSDNSTAWTVADTRTGVTFTTNQVQAFTVPVAAAATTGLAGKVTLLAQRIGAEIKAIYASKGAANGIATLGSDSKVPTAQLPAKLYQPNSYLPGVPAASDVLLSVTTAVNASFPVDFAGSYATADTAATATTVCVIKKGTTQVGTATFAAGATVGTFVLAGGVSLPIGTRLTITAPATPDATLAGVGFVLAGTYS